jgi:multisubunit Na+/H+ antiporter MnhC subunit
MEYVALSTAFALILIGLWGILSNRNIIKIIVGFSLFDTGLHVLIVSLGYVRNGTAPILDKAVTSTGAQIVDPIPQALVLTAIVIGLGVTALMLGYALKLYQKRKSLDARDFKELKW